MDPSALAPGSTIEEMLSADHRRLEGLLETAQAGGGKVDRQAYDAFRAGLLRHIAVEEKVVLPAAVRARGGEPLAVAVQLRLQHGAIAALLVPSPTHGILALLGRILARHNYLEEGPSGLYSDCDRLLAGELPAVMERLRATPQVRVAPCNDAPGVLESVARALERAGLREEAAELRTTGGA